MKEWSDGLSISPWTLLAFERPMLAQHRFRHPIRRRVCQALAAAGRRSADGWRVSASRRSSVQLEGRGWDPSRNRVLASEVQIANTKIAVIVLRAVWRECSSFRRKSRMLALSLSGILASWDVD